jgi:pimeloyl-ACP methyl ester carboxylesterase
MLLEVEGATIYYEVDGPMDAPVVVHWNGAQCTLRMWDTAVPRINDQFRCVRFDAGGIGKSSPTNDADTQYTFERYSADVNAILDSMEVQNAHICRSSNARISPAISFLASTGRSARSAS